MILKPRQEQECVKRGTHTTRNCQNWAIQILPLKKFLSKIPYSGGKLSSLLFLSWKTSHLIL